MKLTHQQSRMVRVMDRGEELDPSADVIRMISDLFNKPVRQIDVDLQKEIWEQDNANRGNG